jgi:hypothetical protein
LRIELLEARRLFADVLFNIDALSNVHAISRYIYGTNQTIAGYANPTFVRSGGNRMTGYNWETNHSNAGADYFHHSDFFLTNFVPNLPPGAAVQPMIQSAGQNGRGAIVTIPMAGYVAADANGTVDETQIAPSSRWRQIAAKKASVYPGSSLSLNPDKTDGFVFTDEFVNWAQQTKQPGQPVFFNLDNEPGLWGESLPAGWQSGNPNSNPPLQPSPQGRTHPTIHPFAPTFTEMRDKSVAHASAIKDVAPDALVFGGVGYGWNEFTTLQDSPGRVTTPSHPGGDQAGEMHYYEWLLNEMRIAEQQQGRTLMDVLDLHWYPEARGGGVRIVFEGGSNDPNNAGLIAARLQAPRSLWDTSYTETSWITQFSTIGPIALLPKVKRDIADFKPGTKIAITEYNYGGGGHISGAISQADVLGIFGREGVFAANLWSLGGNESFVGGAFNMFRNYDGTGGTFGDTSIGATTSNVANTSVYASYNASDPGFMTVVAINKTAGALSAALNLANVRAGAQANVYRLTSASATPQNAGTIAIANPASFEYVMPAYSVTTLRIPLAPPAITTTDFQFETAPNQLRVTFSQNVAHSLSVGDITVTPAGGGAAIPVTLADFDAVTNTATFALPTGLADGDYTATIPAAGVTDGAGNPLAAPLDFDFFVFTGDANRDRSININDFAILAGNFNAPGTYSAGDFNYDAIVNIADFSILASKFNTSLAAGEPPARPVIGAAPATRSPFSPRRVLLDLEPNDHLRLADQI